MEHKPLSCERALKEHIINYHFFCLPCLSCLHSIAQYVCERFLITALLVCMAKSLKLLSAYCVTRASPPAKRMEIFVIFKDNLITSDFCLFLFSFVVVVVDDVCHVRMQFCCEAISCSFAAAAQFHSRIRLFG